MTHKHETAPPRPDDSCDEWDAWALEQERQRQQQIARNASGLALAERAGITALVVVAIIAILSLIF